jgi:hypothetical protein
MLYAHVKITRDTNTTYHRAMPEWEIPVLEFIFDPGNVTKLGTTEKVERAYPSAAEEFSRLTQAYGSDPKTDIPHVASVFGQQGAGVRALGRMIDEAKAAEAEAEAAAAKATPKARAPCRVPAEADALAN